MNPALVSTYIGDNCKIRVREDLVVLQSELSFTLELKEFVALSIAALAGLPLPEITLLDNYTNKRVAASIFVTEYFIYTHQEVVLLSGVHCNDTLFIIRKELLQRWLNDYQT